MIESGNNMYRVPRVRSTQKLPMVWALWRAKPQVRIEL